MIRDQAFELRDQVLGDARLDADDNGRVTRRKSVGKPYTGLHDQRRSQPHQNLQDRGDVAVGEVYVENGGRDRSRLQQGQRFLNTAGWTYDDPAGILDRQRQGQGDERFIFDDKDVGLIQQRSSTLAW
jgi:hypothetical protein